MDPGRSFGGDPAAAAVAVDGVSAACSGRSGPGHTPSSVLAVTVLAVAIAVAVAVVVAGANLVGA